MNKDFYDLCFDVWMSGGNPDLVDEDRFIYNYDNKYDFVTDIDTLNHELRLQKGKEGEDE